MRTYGDRERFRSAYNQGILRRARGGYDLLMRLNRLSFLRAARHRPILERLGHVGLWAGLYVTGAYVCFWQLSAAGMRGSWPHPAAVVSVLLAATAVYAVDRVKLFDTWLDPADPIAQPRRYGFLLQYTAHIRALAVVLLVMAMTVAYMASPWMPILVAMAIVGVVLYAPAGREKGWRIKDILGIKNLYVAGSVVALAIVATTLVGPLSRAHGDQFWSILHTRASPIVLAAIVLLVRVSLDAALCDIDDHEADRQSGTRTLANTLGVTRTLYLAVIGRVVLALCILALPVPAWSLRVGWCVAGVTSALSLVFLRRHSLRDWVDGVLMMEAVGVSLIFWV